MYWGSNRAVQVLHLGLSVAMMAHADAAKESPVSAFREDGRALTCLPVGLEGIEDGTPRHTGQSVF